MASGGGKVPDPIAKRRAATASVRHENVRRPKRNDPSLSGRQTPTPIARETGIGDPAANIAIRARSTKTPRRPSGSASRKRFARATSDGRTRANHSRIAPIASRHSIPIAKIAGGRRGRRANATIATLASARRTGRPSIPIARIAGGRRGRRASATIATLASAVKRASPHSIRIARIAGGRKGHRASATIATLASAVKRASPHSIRIARRENRGARSLEAPVARNRGEPNPAGRRASPGPATGTGVRNHEATGAHRMAQGGRSVSGAPTVRPRDGRMRTSDRPSRAVQAQRLAERGRSTPIRHSLGSGAGEYPWDRPRPRRPAATAWSAVPSSRTRSTFRSSQSSSSTTRRTCGRTSSTRRTSRSASSFTQRLNRLSRSISIWSKAIVFASGCCRNRTWDADVLFV